MNDLEFFQFLKKWRNYAKYPPKTGWPTAIDFDSLTWSGVEKLSNLTSIDGNEYETSLFYIEGKTFMTTPLRGSTDHVNATHKAFLKYEIDQRKKVYYANIYIDDELISKKAIKPENITGDADLGFLFNLHTHPEHINAYQERTYSFFSVQDLQSLLNNKMLAAGLVTDQLWLVVKTDETINRIGTVGEEMLQEISEHAFAGDTFLDDIIQEKMSRWGLIFYRGKFKETLKRVN